MIDKVARVQVTSNQVVEKKAFAVTEKMWLSAMNIIAKLVAENNELKADISVIILDLQKVENTHLTMENVGLLTR